MVFFPNKVTFILFLSVLGFSPAMAVAQTPTVTTVGAISGFAGTSVDLPVNFTAGGTGVSTLQFDLTLPASLSYVSVTTGSAAATAGKSASGSTITGGVRVLIFGLNQNPIGSGSIAVVRLNIASGTAPATLAVGVTGISASSPTGTAVSTNGVGGAVTVSAPTLPTVTISATDSSASETGLDTGIFTVTRSGSTSGALTVNYTVSGTASAGSDYSALAGSVTIGSGAASATMTVAPIDDAAVEGNETVIVTLSTDAAYVIAAPSSATVTIADNDTALPTVTISATDPNAAEAGPDAGGFTVSRSGSTSGALMVNYTVSGTASAGSDYSALAGSVTIGSGAASAAITVAPIDDSTVEGNETVIVTLSSNAAYSLGSSATAAVTIADDDVDTVSPVISGIGASSITATGAVINWTTDELSDTQVEYGTTAAYGNSTVLVVTAVTSHAAQLGGLQASTLYHYRVKSRNAAGNLAVSGDSTFTTDQETLPPGDVKNFTALPGNGQVTLSWTNPSDADFTGILIRCRTDGVFPVSKDDGTLVLGRTGLPNANESFLQTGLTNGTTYYYSAFSYDTSQNYSMAAHAQASPIDVTIISLSPNSGGIDAEVKISGAKFGSTKGSSVVTFSGIPASVSAWSDTSITTKVPANAKSGPVVVVANGVQSNGVTFKVGGKLAAPGQVRIKK